jgi:16S rRNA (uracil1498-N3)-methyltransferase
MLFYLPDFAHPVLSEPESMHCVKVLRMQKGNELEITDGAGHFGKARILDPNPKRCGLEITSQTTKAKDWTGTLWLAVAPTKNIDRMEWMVEKCTEIGCDGFLFVRTERTERDHLNLERLQKVALSAMKQSGQAWLPEILWASKWSAIPWARFDRIVTADLGSENKKLERKETDSCLLFIGPEGDFTTKELEDLKNRKAESIRLRPQVLRTETAALFALSLAHLSD